MRGVAAVLLACAPLSGCFVFIPGSLINKVSDTMTGDKGEHCVDRNARVGGAVKDPFSGRMYTVVSLSGTSVRCDNPNLPIRAELALIPPRAEVAQQAPAPKAPEPTSSATDADKAAACAKMAAIKPGAPQDEYQAAWAGLNKVGMTWRDCPK